MPESTAPDVNSWLEEELHSQFKHDRKAVDPDWSQVFGEGNGDSAQREVRVIHARPPVDAPPVAVLEHDQLTPLRGPALRIAENMSASLSMPVATSQRVMPVKVIDENRRLINQHRSLAGASKVSYTHLVAWAIVRALEKVPALNQAYSERGNEPFRIVRGEVNL